MDTREDQVEAHRPQNRSSAESKLRWDRKHCPVCLALLNKRRVRFCGACQSHPSADKHCRRCGAPEIWEGKGGDACSSCGLHGTKRLVIALDRE